MNLTYRDNRNDLTYKCDENEFVIGGDTALVSGLNLRKKIFIVLTMHTNDIQFCDIRFINLA
jgi:hypothetical protein